jgi:5-keto 4-deoxyuronate isomerase
LPAHHRYPAVHVTEQNAIKRVVFETPDGGRRIATQLITPETVETCQLSLGLLHLEGGER